MSPSLQTMGFFMSDINFCNTKEQLNHLGEVVTGKVDGSPTGADIDTSTLPYTGQVRKTLPALEEEYQNDIDNFVQVSDELIVDKTTEFDVSIANKEAEADAAIDSYSLLNKGPYASGITLESKFEYITYNGESYFATNPPYTTTATTPDADGNLFAGGYTTLEAVANKISNPNLLSNSNFLTPSPDAITHPNATPESYAAGTQIFSGVYAGDSGCTITLIDGRVNCTAGDYQFKLPNTGGLERVPAFTSSVSDYDGIPKTTGVSHALVSDEYVVTVTPAAGDVFSVKLEQGGVATRHEVGAISTGNLPDYTKITYKESGGKSAIENMVAGFPITAKVNQKVMCEYGTEFVRIGASNNLTNFKITSGIIDPRDFGVVIGEGVADVEKEYNSLKLKESFSYMMQTSTPVIMPIGACCVKNWSPMQQTGHIAIFGRGMTTTKIKGEGFDSIELFDELQENNSNVALVGVGFEGFKAVVYTRPSPTLVQKIESLVVERCKFKEMGYAVKLQTYSATRPEENTELLGAYIVGNLLEDCGSGFRLETHAKEYTVESNTFKRIGSPRNTDDEDVYGIAIGVDTATGTQLNLDQGFGSIINNKFYKVTNDQGGLAGCKSISMFGAGTVIQGNTIRDNKSTEPSNNNSQPIYVKGVGNEISSNKLFNSGGGEASIRVKDAEWEGEENIITNNTIRYSSHNVFAQAKQIPIHVNQGNCVVSNNKIQNPTAAALVITFNSSSVNISGNVIDNLAPVDGIECSAFELRGKTENLVINANSVSFDDDYDELITGLKLATDDYLSAVSITSNILSLISKGSSSTKTFRGLFISESGVGAGSLHITGNTVSTLDMSQRPVTAVNVQLTGTANTVSVTNNTFSAITTGSKTPLILTKSRVNNYIEGLNVGFPFYREGGVPTGAETPHFIGQQYLSNGADIYQSIGMADTDWVKLN